jgi:hypothetical protein
MSKSLKTKHPRDMNTEETLNHLFHPKIVKHVKEIAAKSNQSSKKAPKKTTK